MKGDYEEYYASKAAENKAKQSQFQRPRRPADGESDSRAQYGGIF